MRILATAVAILVGFLILLGYFVTGGPLFSLRVVLLQWAIFMSAFALLVGVLNLFSVHLSKVRGQQTGWPYSLLLIISLLATLLLVTFSGPTGKISLWLFNYIQLPIEGSLIALLAIILIYAGVRMFSRRPTGHVILFLAAALIALLGLTPIVGLENITVFQSARAFLVEVPAVAGARGILLGVALGTIATGLRILIGADRPYGG